MSDIERVEVFLFAETERMTPEQLKKAKDLDKLTLKCREDMVPFVKAMRDNTSLIRISDMQKIINFAEKMLDVKPDSSIAKCWLVECMTGCTCCASDNYHVGPYRTEEAAKDAAKRFHDQKALASQYAKNGVYRVHEHSCEVINGGRVLVDEERVFNGFIEDGCGDYDIKW